MGYRPNPQNPRPPTTLSRVEPDWSFDETLREGRKVRSPVASSCQWPDIGWVSAQWMGRQTSGTQACQPVPRPSQWACPTSMGSFVLTVPY